jgi:NADH:ubiquinone oxidoreductase subunit K
MLNYFLFLAVSFVMFAIGTFGLLCKRNMIRMLLSAEVMFNSALLTLLTLAATTAEPIQGGVVALIAIGVAAAEIGVMISIGILFFKTLGEIDVYKVTAPGERSPRGSRE